MVTEAERSKIIRQIESLQNTRDYAAPELEPQLTRQIEKLLDIIEPSRREN